MGLENSEGEEKQPRLNNQYRTDKLRVYYTNADSLSNKVNELYTIVHDCQPHVIAITEVNPKNSRFPLQVNDISIQGYTLFENISLDSHRGVCIYIKDELQPEKPPIDTGSFSELVWASINP